MDQKDNADTQRQFSLQFALPMTYQAEKYRHLRPLLIAWDSANYHGAHGGFESLLGSYKDFQENNIEFTHPTHNTKMVLTVSSYIVFVGYNLVLSLNAILKEWIQVDDAHRSTMKFLEEAVQAALRKSYQLQHAGEIPDPILKAIASNNHETTDRLFSELIAREVARKNPPKPPKTSE